jgi:hypothetical protein
MNYVPSLLEGEKSYHCSCHSPPYFTYLTKEYNKKIQLINIYIFA